MEKTAAWARKTMSTDYKALARRFATPTHTTRNGSCRIESTKRTRPWARHTDATTEETKAATARNHIDNGLAKSEVIRIRNLEHHAAIAARIYRNRHQKMKSSLTVTKTGTSVPHRSTYRGIAVNRGLVSFGISRIHQSHSRRLRHLRPKRRCMYMSHKARHARRREHRCSIFPSLKHNRCLF